MPDQCDQSPPPPTEVLLAEYGAANDVYLQYDGFRWQAGSFLIAGVFVYWGFLLGAEPEPIVVVSSSLLVAALMACWLFFAMHYRQLYLQKLHRMHEIERLLGMEQHLRFVGQAPSGIRYRSIGPRGHTLDKVVFVITACGGPVLATAAGEWSWLYLLTVPLVGGAVLIVDRNEAALKSTLP